MIVNPYLVVPSSPGGPVFVNGQNCTITDLGGGQWRITKTGGTDGIADAWASTDMAVAQSFQPLLVSFASDWSGITEQEFFGRGGLSFAPASSGILPSTSGQSFLEIYGSGSSFLEATLFPGFNLAGGQVFSATRGSLIQWAVDGFNFGTEVAGSAGGVFYATVAINTLSAYIDVTIS